MTQATGCLLVNGPSCCASMTSKADTLGDRLTTKYGTTPPVDGVSMGLRPVDCLVY